MQETIHSPSVRTEGRKSETGCYHVMNCGSANERVPGQQSVPAERGPALTKGTREKRIGPNPLWFFVAVGPT